MVLPVTIAMIVGMHLLLNKTRLGKSMRAMHSNLALAKVSGIKTGRVTLITWAIVGAITGVGGGFWSFQTQVYPQMGFDVLLDIFAIVVLAGLTSFYGTLIASYIMSFFGEFAGGITIFDIWNISILWTDYPIYRNHCGAASKTFRIARKFRGKRSPISQISFER